jgi:hypothetical protein
MLFGGDRRRTADSAAIDTAEQLAEYFNQNVRRF